MDDFNAENVLKISSDSTNFDYIKKFIKKEIIDRAENGYVSYPLDSENAGIKTNDAFEFICKWLNGLGFETGIPQCLYSQGNKERKLLTVVGWVNGDKCK